MDRARFRLPEPLARRAAFLVPAMLAAALLLPLHPVHAAAAAADTVSARVLYVTESAIYIDAGREQGLCAEGAVQFFRGDSLVAVGRVTALTSVRAVCALSSPPARVAPGDAARFALCRETPPVVVEAPVDGPRSLRRSTSLRGRVGIRMLAIRDAARRGLYQPSVDARIAGPVSENLALDADLRTRQTYRSSADERSRNRTRVHRLSFSWQRPSAPLRVTAGRISSPSLATVSLFDGGLIEYKRSAWGMGLFSGTQPDPVTFGWDGAVREHGGYAEHRGVAGGRGRYVVTAGVIGSYQDGRVNREFAYIQARYTTARLSAHWSQELDLNRSWKADAGERALSPTSTFASARVQIVQGLTFAGGYDNRRNVRLYRDRVTPETEFDDSYRQGLSGGAEIRVSRYAFSASTRRLSGASSGTAASHTLSAEVRSLTRYGLTAGGRSTRLSTDRTQGWLHSGRVSVPQAGRFGAGIEAGIRHEHARARGFAGSRYVWAGADLTAAIDRRWFGMVSIERNFGNGSDQTQLYTSLSYRL